MNLSTFKPALLLLLIALLHSSSAAAHKDADERVESYHQRWNKLVPTSTSLHIAGGMGVFAIGPGWQYGKHQQWETDFLIGFVPKFSTDKVNFTFTLKENYLPWHKQASKRFSWNPLTLSMYIVTITGDEFWRDQPDKYDEGYYFFSTKVRFNLSIGQRFTFHIPEEKRFFSESASLYYELGTNDLYIISAFHNSALKPWDYINLAFGLRLSI